MPLPERLNLALARRCAVACPGCYAFFGQREPDRDAFVRSARVFAAQGMRSLTLSGGDPLTLPDLLGWLADFRAAGFGDIKLDTVGVGIATSTGTAGAPAAANSAGDARGAAPTPTPRALLGAVDRLAIPLDGHDNRSAALFRRGRAGLHDETLALLAALDDAAAAFVAPRLVINTVVHRGNLDVLERIAVPVAALRHLAQWNLFQYQPTDQAHGNANAEFAIGDAEFAAAQPPLQAAFAAAGGAAACVAWRSRAARLGQYLLINSDGVAWLPDAAGLTRSFGCVFGREAEVLRDWARAVAALSPSKAAA